MKRFFPLFLLCASCIAGEPTPSQSPSEQIGQPKTQWLTTGSTNSDQAGANPATTFFISKNRVVVTRLGDGYLITFEP